MKTGLLVLFASLGAALAGPVLAQSTSITTNPDGTLSGSASAGAAPSVSVQPGGGRTDVQAPQPSGDWSGRSVTVQGPNSSATARAWTSGGGQTSVYGSGSPGADVNYRSYGAAATPGYGYARRSDFHHRRAVHRRWRGRHHR